MGTIKKKYSVETEVQEGKVCQMITTGKVNKLPLVSKHKVIPSGVSSFSAKTPLDSLAMSTSNVWSCAVDGGKIITIYLPSNGIIYAKLTNIVDGSLVPGSRLKIVDEASVGYPINGFQCIKLNDNKILIVTCRQNYGSYYPLVCNYKAMVVNIKNGIAYPMAHKALFDTSFQNGGLSKFSVIKLSDVKAVICVSGYTDSGNVKFSEHYLLNITTDEPVYVSGSGRLADIHDGNGAVFSDSGTAVDADNYIFCYNGGNTLYAVMFNTTNFVLTKKNQTTIYYSANHYVSDRRSILLPNGQVLLVYTAESKAYYMLLSFSADKSSANYFYHNILLGTVDFGSYIAIDACILDETHIVLVYNKNDYIINICSCELQPNGTMIQKQLTAVTTTPPDQNAYPRIFKINELRFGLTFTNLTPSPQITNGMIGTSVVKTAEETRGGVYLGIAINNLGDVLLKGVYKTTGLTIGSKYYYDKATGVISTTSSGEYLGVALSSEDLYVPDFIIK